MSDPDDLKDLDDHIRDVVNEAREHGHTTREIAEALERAASDLAGRDDDDDDEDDAA
jgi:uncharacterized protein (UPF0335 family)